MASNDPDFERKAADIIGLYMNPPAHAAMFCIDEKTAIQALDPKDPVLPVSPDWAERHGFEYYRHGTLSLYAAFSTKRATYIRRRPSGHGGFRAGSLLEAGNLGNGIPLVGGFERPQQAAFRHWSGLKARINTGRAREISFMTPVRRDASITFVAIARLSYRKSPGKLLCQAFRRQHACDFVSVMPTNLYGPNDNIDLLSGHVLPAPLAKIDAAMADGRDTVEIWDSGRPHREFLHVDDLADAVVYLMKTWSEEHIGTGTDVTIAELAQLIADIVGFEGRFLFDRSKPDDTRRKLLDVGRLTALGWQPRISLEASIRQTYEWYRASRVGTR